MTIFLGGGLIIGKHSPMPLALSTRGDNLLSQCAYCGKPWMSQGDHVVSSRDHKVVLSSSLTVLKARFSMGRVKVLTPVFLMFDRWSDLETLRLAQANLQEMITTLQVQVDRLHDAIEFRLEPLSHEVEELRQRYDVDYDA